MPRGSVVTYQRLYVGNISYSVDSHGLIEIFREHGVLGERPHIVMDRESGRSKGFGFINVPPEMADTAICALNGAIVGGRTIRVDRAHDRGVR